MAVPTDAHLFTSIVNPDYRLASYPRNEITVGGHSRMPGFAETMTVSELTDIVEFLQTNYHQARQMPAGKAYY